MARAPLASEEGMEEVSPLSLCGTKVEITRGKEFKVSYIINLFHYYQFSTEL